VLAAERRQRWSEEIGLVTAGLQSVAACAFDHSGRPCAAISVTWRQDHTRASHPDLVHAVRTAASELTAALSGHGPEGWFDEPGV
jgi:DNA-binding IclR family transcriptional regulator